MWFQSHVCVSCAACANARACVRFIAHCAAANSRQGQRAVMLLLMMMVAAVVMMVVVVVIHFKQSARPNVQRLQ